MTGYRCVSSRTLLWSALACLPPQQHRATEQVSTIMPPIPSLPHPDYHEYLAWDAPTRWFHWINALAVIGLMATGIMILNDDALGISAAGKVLLKSIHVSFGYVMTVNSALALRLGIPWQ